MLVVENFGKSTNKAVGEKCFGELTQCTKKGESTELKVIITQAKTIHS